MCGDLKGNKRQVKDKRNGKAVRAVIQRVKKASVEVEGNIVGQIQEGILVFLGITHTDTDKQSEYVINKLLNMRLFENEKQQLDRV